MNVSPPGSTEYCSQITTIDDSIKEMGECFMISLQLPSGTDDQVSVSPSASNITCCIADNDCKLEKNAYL